METTAERSFEISSRKIGAQLWQSAQAKEPAWFPEARSPVILTALPSVPLFWVAWWRRIDPSTGADSELSPSDARDG
jgi:hypothetical protein